MHVRLERNDSHALITVNDSGQGIATELLPHVFERFRQADSSEHTQQWWAWARTLNCDPSNRSTHRPSRAIVTQQEPATKLLAGHLISATRNYRRDEPMCVVTQTFSLLTVTLSM